MITAESKPNGEIKYLQAALKSQYHAALAMLKQAIELYPQESWADTNYPNAAWQLAYHTLFFTHLYSQPNEAAFQPWEQHQGKVQYPDAIPGPPIPECQLPLIAEPYTKEQVLQYWEFCDHLIDQVVDTLDLLSPDSGFSWYKVTKLEHQLVNIRHIQHGAAQLAARVRSLTGIGIDWVGAKRRGI